MSITLCSLPQLTADNVLRTASHRKQQIVYGTTILTAIVLPVDVYCPVFGSQLMFVLNLFFIPITEYNCHKPWLTFILKGNLISELHTKKGTWEILLMDQAVIVMLFVLVVINDLHYI